MADPTETELMAADPTAAATYAEAERIRRDTKLYWVLILGMIAYAVWLDTRPVGKRKW